MGVSVKVGSIATEVGASSFLNAFFSTVAVLLEDDQPGKRFPTISHDFYQGQVDAEQVAQAIDELKRIQAELAKHPPTAVVWDREDRTLRPPWGEKISSHITSMTNYFVTSSGRDLMGVLLEVFDHALKTKKAVEIAEI